MQDFNLEFIEPNASLLKKIREYKKRAESFRAFLEKKPNEWGRFQSDFNQEINGIFRDMMIFEKERVRAGATESITRFKKFFRTKLEKYFSYGELITWSQKKPYGYAGDFKIIEDLYENSPRTLGFERLFDNYVQMSMIAVAVRNRKDDFKRMIKQLIEKRRGQEIRIMSLACGPSRELREIVQENCLDLSQVSFDCVDHDEHALKFSSVFFKNNSRFRFIQKNAVKMAVKNDIREYFPESYDLIYSTGLFDYLNTKISIRLITNLKKLLKPGGMIAISDVQDKYSNPSLHFMELVGEWDLLYRDIDEFRDIFQISGFRPEELSYQFEQQGIMQYITARQGS